MYIATVVNARKAHQIWNEEHVERYVDDNFYAFSRGNFFVALTNSKYKIERMVTYQPFADDQTVCNIFYPTSDCVKVINGALPIVLLNGEAKIFVPQVAMEAEEEPSFEIIQ